MGLEEEATYRPKPGSLSKARMLPQRNLGAQGRREESGASKFFAKASGVYIWTIFQTKELIYATVFHSFSQALPCSACCFRRASRQRCRLPCSDNAIVSRTATVEGVSLHYLTAGHGPMVVLIHGYAETSRMWRPIMPTLARAIYGDRAGPAWHRRLSDSG